MPPMVDISANIGGHQGREAAGIGGHVVGSSALCGFVALGTAAANKRYRNKENLQIDPS